MKNPEKKNHSLTFWINIILAVLLGTFAFFLLWFSGMSMRNLMDQEIENQKNILKLNVDNVNNNLSALESYLYQVFADSEEITQLETGDDDTKLFMAEQAVVRTMQQITGWNEAIKFLFFYSPENKEQVFLRAGARSGNVLEKDELETEIRTYINEQLSRKNYLGKEDLLVQTKSHGYLIRFYKVRNSYVGMCVDGKTVLEPLEELTARNDSRAFLCDLDGNVISASEVFREKIHTEDNGIFLKDGSRQYLQLNYLSKEGKFYIGTWTSADIITEQLKDIKVLILLFAVSVLAFAAVVTLAVKRSLYRPIKKMEQGMKRLGDGEWNLAVEDDSRISEYNHLIQNFNEMVTEIKGLKIDNYEKELEAQKSLLQYLQLQVNPHFYLNALNIIYSLAQVKDYKMIQEMTMALVEYSRYMFRKPEQLVTVREEMEHVENYMKIQQMRFPKRIAFHESISSEIEDAVIPPFVIQTFVENSIKYAVNLEQQNVVSVEGKVAEIGEELFVHIEIKDNGQGYSREILDMMQADGWQPDNRGKQVGINNVMKRLSLVFGSKATLVLKNENGARAIMIVPLIWQGENEDG